MCVCVCFLLVPYKHRVENVAMLKTRKCCDPTRAQTNAAIFILRFSSDLSADLQQSLRFALCDLKMQRFWRLQVYWGAKLARNLLASDFLVSFPELSRAQQRANSLLWGDGSLVSH